MSLSHAFQQLSDAELATCFLHTTLFIDEAHHVQSSEEGMNQLGRIIEFLLGRNDRSTRLVLATAYFFRGDHLPIIDDKHLVKFRRHHVPFDDYWNSLRHVKTYSYEFVIYKGTVFRDLDLILAGESVPTIVYCPPEGHRMLLGKTKKLSNEKINAVEQIPWWKWSSNVNRWQAKYDRVSKLPDPPKRGTKDADWVRTQRKTYNENRLLSDRIEKLELISWWTWTARRSNRNEGLAILKNRLPQWAKSGVNKADARFAWSQKMGVGEDQIHKYIRKLPADLRELWKRLPHSISAPTAL
ncbi:MAG: helicase associated domain-containing protein [Rubripirellula sp.]